MRNKSVESSKNSKKNDRSNISKEIENLINNYSSKKKEIKSYNSDNSEDIINNGLIQIKEENKEKKDPEINIKSDQKDLILLKDKIVSENPPQLKEVKELDKNMQIK